jgi:hypothetical protein
LKFATACFMGLFLLSSHVDLMFCHCVLLDEAVASWENFCCVCVCVCVCARARVRACGGVVVVFFLYIYI